MCGGLTGKNDEWDQRSDYENECERAKRLRREHGDYYEEDEIYDQKIRNRMLKKHTTTKY